MPRSAACYEPVNRCAQRLSPCIPTFVDSANVMVAVTVVCLQIVLFYPYLQGTLCWCYWDLNCDVWDYKNHCVHMKLNYTDCHSRSVFPGTLILGGELSSTLLLKGLPVTAGRSWLKKEDPFVGLCGTTQVPAALMRFLVPFLVAVSLYSMRLQVSLTGASSSIQTPTFIKKPLTSGIGRDL